MKILPASLAVIQCVLGLAAFNPSARAQEETYAPAPKGSPSEAAWGFWPDVPKAWQQTHRGFVEKARAGGVDVLFLGDSLTKGWAEGGKEIWDRKYAPMKSLNIGIGGDTTRQILWRLDHGAMQGIHPRVIVLMIGVNNIFTATGSDEEIAEGVAAILRKIHSLSPGSKVLLLGILPISNPEQSARAERINALLAKLEDSQVVFLDMTSRFKKDGRPDTTLYLPDGTHLAAPGYVVWDEAMFPALRKMAD